jgi:hypothetical protein
MPFKKTLLFSILGLLFFVGGILANPVSVHQANYTPIDTFSSKFIPRFGQSEIQLGKFEAGDTLFLQLDNIRGGKLREIEFRIEDRILFSQTGIRKELPPTRIFVATGGKGVLFVENKCRLFPRTFDLLVKLLPGQAGGISDQLPESFPDIVSHSASDSIQTEQGIVHFIRNPQNQVINHIEVYSPSRTLPIAQIENRYIPAFKTQSFDLGELEAGDTIVVSFPQENGGTKIKEVFILSNEDLIFSKGKVKPKDLGISLVSDSVAVFQLVISNKGRLFRKKVSFKVEKRTAPSLDHFVRDTVDYYDCFKRVEKDTFEMVFEHAFQLNNALDLERGNRILLELQIPDSLQNRAVTGWYYQIIPPQMLPLQEVFLDTLQLEDPFPSLSHYLCYAFVTEKKTKDLFFSNPTNCTKIDFFSRQNFFRNVISSEDKKVQTLFFMGKNLNETLGLEGLLQVFARYTLRKEGKTKCPKVIYRNLKPASQS